jgi:ubiquinone/menaquinone biosynthesis C-methylase UbiE
MLGINLGCGKEWNCPKGWVGIDAVRGHVLNENSSFAYEDNQFDIAYSSHFFEHIDDKVSMNIFKETYRVLKKGSVFTIIVPDFEKLHKCFIEKHPMWKSPPLRQYRGIRKKYNCWEKYNIKPTAQNALLNWFSNYHFSDRVSKDWYEGPPIRQLKMSESEIKDMLYTKNTKEVCKILHEKCYEIKKNFPKKTTLQHINFWNIEKFEEMLINNVGFSSIVEVNSKSMNNIYNQVKWTDTNPHASLYLEVTK